MPLPVISIAQMREWEVATWGIGQTEAEVIRHVGKALGQSVLEMTRPGDSVLILAGKGNNGQDALASRGHLSDRRLNTLEITNPGSDLPKLEHLLSLRPNLIVDGLFGIGINRPLDADWVRVIARVNSSGAMILAVDVPSGLNADTGEPQVTAMKATATLTVGAAKRGMLEQSAWPYVGRLEVAADVGLASCAATSDLQWTLPEDFTSFPPRRGAAAYKSTYGHLAIIAGSLGYHGAAVLAARAAQRAQPGLITLFTPEDVYHAIAPQMQAVMVSPWQPAPKLNGPYTAVLIGPGLAAPTLPDQAKLLVRYLWRDWPAPVIVDASALDWLPLDSTPRNATRVITPHPGEAARLLRSTAQQIQAKRFESLRNISQRYGGACVVLKGHQTLIGGGSGNVYVNCSGNPHLAQGGSGDALAGYLAGLLAQPVLQAESMTAIRYAVWQHGAASDYLQQTKPNWTVEDLIGELGRVSANKR